MSKGVKKPYVECLGMSATEVTGSLYKVRFQDHYILVECGMYQGAGNPLDNYTTNKDMMKKIRPKDVECVVISHCHSDHSGNVPYIFARGGNPRVIVPTGCKRFLEIMWMDSLNIMRNDEIKLLHKHNIKAPPLYDEQAIQKALSKVVEIDLHQTINLFPNVQLTYYDAGHIKSSAQIYLEFTAGYAKKRIGFTGDIGNVEEKAYTTKRESLPFVDVLFGECTYSSPARPNLPNDRIKDLEKVKWAIENCNNVLFPVFSLSRCQQIMKMLADNFKGDFWIDSPLCQKISAVWDDSNEWQQIINKFKFTADYEESKRLQDSIGKKIVLSSSGFLSGGRVLKWLSKILPDEHNAIIFVGFAGDNGLASQIKSAQLTVEIEGNQVANRAKLLELRSFSSHANYYELMDYYTQCEYNKIILVHGDYDEKVEFAKVLQDKLVAKARSAKAIACGNDYKIYF